MNIDREGTYTILRCGGGVISSSSCAGTSPQPDGAYSWSGVDSVGAGKAMHAVALAAYMRNALVELETNGCSAGAQVLESIKIPPVIPEL